MATQFQHRLVGTVILVALGVIFLPDVLDGKQDRVPDEAVTIPLRPDLEQARPLVAVPVEPSASTHSAASDQQTQEAENWSIEQAKEAPPVAPKPTQAVQAPPMEAVVAAPTKAARDEPSTGQATQSEPVKSPSSVAEQQASHIIQLGAFRNAANVNALVTKLKNAGYSAHTTPSRPREGEINRVWIGPDSQARLEQQLSALEQLTGLKGSVRAQ